MAIKAEGLAQRSSLDTDSIVGTGQAAKQRGPNASVSSRFVFSHSLH